MEAQEKAIRINDYFPELDGIRCIAISLVLFGHWMIYTPLIGLNIAMASSGVNLFFILSGFLITRILLIQKIDYNVQGIRLFYSFYVRRMLRIFPLYFAVIGIGLILSVPGAAETLLRLVTFTLNIPDSGFGMPRAVLFSHFWSLSAEEQFYLFFPFLIILFPAKNLKIVFITMLCFGLASRIVVYTLDTNFYFKEWLAHCLSPCTFDSFALGAILAYLFCYQKYFLKKLIQTKILVIIVFLFFGLTGFLKTYNHEGVFANLFFRFSFSLVGFYFIAIVLLRSMPSFIQSFLTNFVIGFIGKISYGIYVLHNFMPWIFAKMGLHHFLPVSVFAQAVAYGMVTFMLATMSWFLFEKPINQLKSRFPYRGQ